MKGKNTTVVMLYAGRRQRPVGCQRLQALQRRRVECRCWAAPSQLALGPSDTLSLRFFHASPGTTVLGDSFLHFYPSFIYLSSRICWHARRKLGVANSATFKKRNSWCLALARNRLGIQFSPESIQWAVSWMGRGTDALRQPQRQRPVECQRQQARQRQRVECR